MAIFNENLGRIAEQYLRKGSKVYLEGQLETRKWQDQSGQDRYSTEVVLRQFRGELTLLDGRGEGAGAGGGDYDQDRGARRRRRPRRRPARSTTRSRSEARRRSAAARGAPVPEVLPAARRVTRNATLPKTCSGCAVPPGPRARAAAASVSRPEWRAVAHATDARAGHRPASADRPSRGRGRCSVFAQSGCRRCVAIARCARQRPWQAASERTMISVGALSACGREPPRPPDASGAQFFSTMQSPPAPRRRAQSASASPRVWRPTWA